MDGRKVLKRFEDKQDVFEDESTFGKHEGDRSCRTS